MRASSEENRPTRAGGERIAWLSGGGALLAVVLMLAAPVASAGAVHPALVLKAKDFGASTSSDTTSGACGTAKVSKGPSWAPRSGEFRASVSGTSPLCPTSKSQNEGEATASMSLELSKFTIPTSGNHTLTVAWSMTVNETWGMTPYTSCKLNYKIPGSICDTYTEDTLYAYVMMFDLSNSTWGQYGYGYSFGTFIDIYLTSFEYVQNSTYGNYSYGTPGNHTFAGTYNVSNVLNLSGTSVINSHDTYELQLYMEVQSLAFAYTSQAKATGAASAYATIDADTHGNGVKLQSIIVH